MFTLEQIMTAHSKVRSGADFPAYIQDLKNLGIKNYETYVSDGHTDYSGADDYKISSGLKYDEISISENLNPEQFKTDLKSHQSGNTSFLKFCEDCAQSGIVKWSVDLEKMMCTYFDKSENEILVEKIPG